MRLIDAHTHVQFSAFEKDWRDVLKRALNQNIVVINVGTQRDTSRRAIEIARQFHYGVYATVGLHPIHTGKSFHDPYELGGGEAAKAFTSRGETFDSAYYRDLARDMQVVAIGECGLDYFRIEGDPAAAKEAQKQAFVAQIELARDVKKPLMIHCRDAFGDLIDVLRTNRNRLNDPPGAVHFFTGTADDARQLLDLGFAFTFGGVITFARNYDEAIGVIPSDRILSETDAPYVAPLLHRGKRNEPAYVVEAVKKLSELKGVSVEAMAERIFENAKRIFSLRESAL